MATKLRSSLLFIDSDYSVNGLADTFSIDIPPNAISCGNRQFLRLILQEFHGYKNYYNVNTTNNTLRLKIDAAPFQDISIDPNNYETFHEIADNLADKLITALAGAGATYTKGTILPLANKIPSSTTNRLMSITLTYSAGTAPGSFLMQTREIPNTFGSSEFSDSYALLGGIKITNSSDAGTNSFNVTIGGGGDITITGYFPMQRSTCEHVYLRTSLVNNNLGSKSTHTGNNHGQDLSGTNIMAKIPVQSEFISYSSDSGTGFFVDVPIQNLTHVHFTVTDAKNRRLPQVSTGQAEYGNMNYSFVIRVDVMSYGQDPQPNELLLPKPELPRQNLAPYLQDGAPPRRRVPY